MKEFPLEFNKNSLRIGVEESMKQQILEQLTGVYDIPENYTLDINDKMLQEAVGQQVFSLCKKSIFSDKMIELANSTNLNQSYQFKFKTTEHFDNCVTKAIFDNKTVQARDYLRTSAVDQNAITYDHLLLVDLLVKHNVMIPANENNFLDFAFLISGKIKTDAQAFLVHKHFSENENILPQLTKDNFINTIDNIHDNLSETDKHIYENSINLS